MSSIPPPWTGISFDPPAMPSEAKSVPITDKYLRSMQQQFNAGIGTVLSSVFTARSPRNPTHQNAPLTTSVFFDLSAHQPRPVYPSAESEGSVQGSSSSSVAETARKAGEVVNNVIPARRVKKRSRPSDQSTEVADSSVLESATTWMQIFETDESLDGLPDSEDQKCVNSQQTTSTVDIPRSVAHSSPSSEEEESIEGVKRVRRSEKSSESSSSSGEGREYSLVDADGHCIPELVFSDEKESDDEFDNQYPSFLSSSSSSGFSGLESEEYGFGFSEGWASDEADNVEEVLPQKIVRTRWSELELRTIRRLIKDEMETTEIQKEFSHRSKAAVRSMVEKIKNPKPPSTSQKSDRIDWSDKEIEIVIDLANRGANRNEIFEKLPGNKRTLYAISAQVRAQKKKGTITIPVKSAKEICWTSEEDKELATLYEKTPLKDIGTLSIKNRSPQACKSRITYLRRIGLVTRIHRRHEALTDTDKSIIERMVKQGFSNPKIAARIQRSKWVVERYRAKMPKKPEATEKVDEVVIPVRSSGKKWSDKDDEMLAKLAKKGLPVKMLAAKLKCSLDSVYRRLSGLYKSGVLEGTLKDYKANKQYDEDDDEETLSVRAKIPRWTEEEDELIRQAIRDGKSWSELVPELSQRTPDAIKVRYFKNKKPL